MVADRESAVPQAGALEALAALTGKLAFVGVVSGRPLRFLISQLGRLPGLALFGLYGLERSVPAVQEPFGPGESERASPRAGPRGLEGERSRWELEMARLASQAESEAVPGVEVERKGLSVALHVRGRREALGWVLNWAREQAEASGLVAQPGRLSVELLPPAAAGGKARVVEEVGAGVDALCFIGDDVGDLAAFEAVRRLRSVGKAGIAVGVASPEQPAGLAGSVDLLLDGPAAVVALLRSIAQPESRRS